MDDFAIRMRENRAWKTLCRRLNRAPHEAEEDNTLSMRAAWKAMLAFEAEERERNDKK